VIDRERAALLGLSVGQVARAVQTFINGYDASIFSDPRTGNQYDINVRARESDRTSLADLGQIFIFNPQGRPISLTTSLPSPRGRADPDRTEIPAADHSCHRQHLRPGPGQRGRGYPGQPRQAAASPNFKINLSGTVESQQESFIALLGAFILAVILVYMVLASQFKSFWILLSSCSPCPWG